MSHETLRREAEHLQNSSNPEFIEGGRKLAEVADILLQYGAIPANDPKVEFIVFGEASVLGPSFLARDFELQTGTGKLFKDGENVGILTPMEFKLLERVLMEPGAIVPKEKILQHMYNDGMVDQGRMDGFKTHLKRVRSKLPVDLKTAEEILETVISIGVRYNHFEKED